MPTKFELSLPPMTTAYEYSVGGLGLRSEIELPELVPGRGVKQDITFRFGAVSDPSSEVYSGDVAYCRSWISGEATVLEWEDAGRFAVRNGSEIVVDRAHGAPMEHVRLIVLGPAFAVLLQQRPGYLVLHGSSVSMGGNAAVFIGGKGYGKSTLAAAVHARGHRVLSDDVIAIDMTSPEGPMVTSLFPQVKLWPEAVQALGLDLDALPRLSDVIEKRELVAAQAVGSFPLRAVYSLGLGPKLSAVRLPAGHSMIDIVRNSYISRFGAGIAALGQKARFRAAADLVTNVPVFRFERENNLDRIGDSARFVERHMIEFDL